MDVDKSAPFSSKKEMRVDLKSAGTTHVLELLPDDDGCLSARAPTPLRSPVRAVVCNGDSTCAVVTSSSLPVLRTIAPGVSLIIVESGQVYLSCADERPDAYGHTVVREIPFDARMLDTTGPTLAG